MSIKKFPFFAYAALVLLLTWPIFEAWFPIFGKGWRWYPIGVLFGVFAVSEFFRTKQFFYFALYSIVVLLNVFSGDKYINDPISAIARILGVYFILTAPLLILRKGNETVAKFFSIVFLLLFIYTSIVSFILSLQFPDVVRNDLTFTGLTDYYEYSYLYRFGLTKYQFAHSVPILIPPFVMAFRYRNVNLIRKIFYGVGIALCIIHVFASGSTTAFFVALVALVLSFVVNEGPQEKNTRRLILFGIILLPLMSSTVIDGLLGFIDSFLGEGAIHEHILDLQQSARSSDVTGDLAARQDVYTISWNEFFSSPIWGTNNNPGHHSVFLDHMAAFGLLGFFPFVMVLWLQTKTILKRLSPNQKYYYYVCAFCTFFLLASKQVDIWTMCCFLYIAAPLFFIYSSREKSIMNKK